MNEIKSSYQIINKVLDKKGQPIYKYGTKQLEKVTVKNGNNGWHKVNASYKGLPVEEIYDAKGNVRANTQYLKKGHQKSSMIFDENGKQIYKRDVYINEGKPYKAEYEVKNTGMKVSSVYDSKTGAEGWKLFRIRNKDNKEACYQAKKLNSYSPKGVSLLNQCFDQMVRYYDNIAKHFDKIAKL